MLCPCLRFHSAYCPSACTEWILGEKNPQNPFFKHQVAALGFGEQWSQEDTTEPHILKTKLCSTLLICGPTGTIWIRQLPVTEQREGRVNGRKASNWTCTIVRACVGVCLCLCVMEGWGGILCQMSQSGASDAPTFRRSGQIRKFAGQMITCCKWDYKAISLNQTNNK